MQKMIRLAVVRLALMFGIAFVATQIVPRVADYPYIQMLRDFGLPEFVYSWSGFDGAHYGVIAQRGYRQFQQAFFPLYPILLSPLVKLLGGNFVIAGIIISNTLFVGALVLAWKILKKYCKKHAAWIIAFALLFPTAYYYSAVYTESLFVFLSLLSLYALTQKRPLLAAVTAVLGGLTRIQGVFLVIPLFFYFFDIRKPFLAETARVIRQKWYILFAPVLGLCMYMGYLWATTGDPIYFLTSQPSFGANRSTSLVILPQVYYRYFKIFVTADWSFVYFVAILEFVFTSFALALTLWHAWISYVGRKTFEIGIALYSLAHIVLPTLTGTFSSMPRYTLLAVSMYLVLGRLESTRLKFGIAIVFGLVQIVMLSLFIQGYFVS